MSTNVELAGENLAEFQVYLDCGVEPLAKEQVSIVLDREKYNAKPLTGVAAECSDANWNKRIEANPRLFNALKFRLASYRQLNSSESKTIKVELHMGITDYKTFLSTNRASDPKLVAALPDPMEPVLAQVLGISALVLTADGMVIMHRRSEHLAEFAGWWDVPGGHPEPSDVEIEREAPNGLSQEARAAEGGRALDELFSSIQGEVHDELNIPHEAMEGARLIGVVKAKASRWRPSAVFLIPVKLTGEEVIGKFREGAKDAYESLSVAAFDVDSVVAGAGPVRHLASPSGGSDDGGNSPLDFKDIAETLVPSAGLAVYLLRKHKFHKLVGESNPEDSVCCPM